MLTHKKLWLAVAALLATVTLGGAVFRTSSSAHGKAPLEEMPLAQRVQHMQNWETAELARAMGESRRELAAAAETVLRRRVARWSVLATAEAQAEGLALNRQLQTLSPQWPPASQEAAAGLALRLLGVLGRRSDVGVEDLAPYCRTIRLFQTTRKTPLPKTTASPPLPAEITALRSPPRTERELAYTMQRSVTAPSPILAAPVHDPFPIASSPW